MKAQHRQAVIECLVAVATTKKTQDQAKPLVDLISVNNKQFGNGWMCSKPPDKTKKLKQIDLDQCDRDLYVILCLAVSSSPLAVKDKRGLILDAFGLSRHHRNARDIAKPESHKSVLELLLMPTKASGRTPTKETQKKEVQKSVSTPDVLMQRPPQTPILSDDSEGEDDNSLPIVRGNLFGHEFKQRQSTKANTGSFNHQAGSLFRRKKEDSSTFKSPHLPGSKKRQAFRQSPAVGNFTPGSKFAANPRQRNRPSDTPVRHGNISKSVSLDADENFQSLYEEESNLPDPANQLVLTPSLSALDFREQTSGVKLTEDYLAQKAAHSVISRLPQKDGIVSLSFIDRQKKMRVAKVMPLPIPRAGKKSEDERETKKRALRKAAKLKALVDCICLTATEKDLVLQKYAEMYTEFGLVEKEKDNSGDRLSVVEAICIRDFTGTSTNGICRLAKALKLLKGIEVFPLGMKKRIAEKEKEAVPMNCQYAELTASKEKKLCLFLSCSNPALLLERMISTSIIAGKQRDSCDVSNYRNSNLIFIGLDRGGGDIYLGIRNGNRSDGNQANYCFPLAVVEDASEDYSNVKQTFFGKDSIVERMHQDLIDDSIHTVEISIKTKAGELTGAACVAMRLLPSNWSQDRFSHSSTKVVLQRRVDFTINLGAIRGSVVEAGNRDRATPVVVPSLVATNDKQQLTCSLDISLLLDPSIGYIGLRLFDPTTNTILLTFLFDKHLERPVEGRAKIRCNLVRGFPSHDGKCALCISGQSSASSSMPCLRCIADKATFRNYRAWMHHHRPTEVPVPTTADAPDRSGELSNLQCYEVFKKETGDGMCTDKAVKVGVKKQSHSVVNPPCARVDPLKESGGPMHVSSGLIDHLIDDTRKRLKEIDAKGPLMKELEELKVLLESISKAAPDAGNLANKVHDAEFAKSLDRGRRRLQELNSAPSSTERDAKVAAAEAQIEQIQASRFHHASTSGLGFNNLLKKGAEELLELVKAFLSARAKKVCGEAEYVFNKAIELTGAKFRKEHGGMSLSNAHSIKVAEHYQLVVDTVRGAYSDDEALRAEVDEVMSIFCRLAEPSYRIAVLLKSQEKTVAEKIHKLKDAVCDFSIPFRELYPDRSVYPKLHYLECILVCYAVRHGFIGLGSEEGFESAHNRLRWIKTLLHSMPVTKDRGEKMGQRYQTSLLPEFEETWRILNPAVVTRSGGSTYRKKSSSEKESKLIERLNGATQIEAGLVRLSSGNIIYESWREYYDYLSFGVVTGRMKRALDNEGSAKLVEKKPDLGKLLHYLS